MNFELCKWRRVDPVAGGEGEEEAGRREGEGNGITSGKEVLEAT